MTESLSIVLDGPSTDERTERLARSADDLTNRRDGAGILRNQRFLVYASAVLTTLGLSLILLAWSGASQATLVQEQMAYLISGGLLGVALATLGGLTFFSHWIVVLIRENRETEARRRRDTEDLLRAVQLLTLATEEVAHGLARRPERQRPVRAASRGS